MNEDYTIFAQCIKYNGELLGSAIPLDTSGATYVCDLKEMRKEKKSHDLDRIAALRLILWELKEQRHSKAIRSKDPFEKLGVLSEEDENVHHLKPTDIISSEGPWPEGFVHVLA